MKMETISDVLELAEWKDRQNVRLDYAFTRAKKLPPAIRMMVEGRLFSYRGLVDYIDDPHVIETRRSVESLIHEIVGELCRIEVTQ